MVTFDEFKKLEIKTAIVKEVRDHPNADKLYIIKVEIGEEERELVAGLKKIYSPEELVGKMVVVITNLEPAVIRGVESKGMLLATSDGQVISVLITDKKVKSGSPIL